MTFPVVSFRGARSLRSTIWLRYGSALAALGAVAAVGFATAAATPPPPQPLALSVSFLDLMRATFDPTAAGIWGAQGAEALAEEDWLLVEKDAVELVGATTLLSGAGAGANDSAWAAAPDWRAWTLELQQAALQVRAAAQTKDVDKLNVAADQMSDLCLACHAKYQTQAPADGVTRYPFYPARVRPVGP